MKRRVNTIRDQALGQLGAIIVFSSLVYADIPAPKAEAQGTDWTFVLTGAVCAFLGAILFLWIGRKLSKRS